MKQGSLDFDEDIFSIKFSAKDMFFNNGIVNLYQFLQVKSFDIEINFDDSGLELKMDSQKSEEVYFEILQGFLKDYKIVSFHPKNERIFYDFKQNKFIQSNKVNIQAGGSNDSKNVLIKMHIDDLTIAKDVLLKEEEIYKSKYDNSEKDDFKITKCYYDKYKKELYVLSELDEHIKKYSKFLVKSDFIVLNSSIHSFEDGQDYFQDMLKQPKNYKIDKWDALIYWFGGRVQRFYNYSYFIYPNSSNMSALYKFKEFLKINDDKTQIRDEKTGKIKEIGTNIDFFKTLSKDGIVNKNFYISKSEEEFEVKFFMYLFSTIYHVQEQYDKANDRRKARKKELYDALMQVTFVVYTDDGTFKTSFNEYTKAYKLIEFFELIKEKDLFKYLAHLFVVFSLSQGNKEVNLNFKNWCQNILNFSRLRREYYLTSFNILKNDSMGFGKNLFEFEQFYLQNILGGKDMSIHEKSKKLGEQIGVFTAKNLDFLDKKGDKDLLFKLRNIKNSKQLISFLKDVEFTFLKEYQSESKKNYYLNTKDILEIPSAIDENWEIIRDYIAIYAINQYKYELYKKNKGDK